MKTRTIILIFAAALTACTAGFEDLNKNPNQMEVGSVSPMSLLPNILYSGASGMVGQSYLLTN